ncbi:hypothetical protein DP49_5017 [Burkholderia pseudomallei]|nr:hypothetical protein DP49_5017 [Burkholderia pseudomallei]
MRATARRPACAAGAERRSRGYRAGARCGTIRLPLGAFAPYRPRRFTLRNRFVDHPRRPALSSIAVHFETKRPRRRAKA